MGRKGRPTHSIIRQQIIELLHIMGEAYGYEIHRLHKAVFTPCTREVVYYHLKKGVSLGEIVIAKVVSEQGNFSWGPAVQKTYYAVGPSAKPNPDPQTIEKVKAILAQRKMK